MVFTDFLGKRRSSLHGLAPQAHGHAVFCLKRLLANSMLLGVRARTSGARPVIGGLYILRAIGFRALVHSLNGAETMMAFDASQKALVIADMPKVAR